MQEHHYHIKRASTYAVSFPFHRISWLHWQTSSGKHWHLGSTKGRINRILQFVPHEHTHITMANPMLMDTTAEVITLPCKVCTLLTSHKVHLKLGQSSHELAKVYSKLDPNFAQSSPKLCTKFSSKVHIEMETYFPHLPYMCVLTICNKTIIVWKKRVCCTYGRTQ